MAGPVSGAALLSLVVSPAIVETAHEEGDTCVKPHLGVVIPLTFSCLPISPLVSFKGYLPASVQY